MNTRGIPRSLGLIFVSTILSVSGCNKEKSASSNSGGPTATSAASNTAGPTTAPASFDVTGVWQAAKIQKQDGTSQSGGIWNDILARRIELRANHTYGWTDPMIGHIWGTWNSDGNVVQLANPRSRGTPTTLKMQSPNLVDDSISDAVIVFERKGAAPPDTSPKFHLTADTLEAEVRKNFAAALAKYGEVSVEMTGVVTNIDNMASGPYVYVAGPAPAGTAASELFGGIRCDPMDRQPWVTLGRLQPVKVTGVAHLAQDTCEISEARFTLDGPSVFVTLTAAELASAFAKDADGTKDKYANKSIILTGTLLEKQMKSGAPSVLILGKADGKVVCEYSNDGADNASALDPLQAGQEVKLVGNFYTITGDTSPKLSKCNVIAK